MTQWEMLGPAQTILATYSHTAINHIVLGSQVTFSSGSYLEMAQWLKVLATKSKNQSSVPKSHCHRRKEPAPQSCPPPYTHTNTHTLIPTHTTYHIHHTYTPHTNIHTTNIHSTHRHNTHTQHTPPHHTYIIPYYTHTPQYTAHTTYTTPPIPHRNYTQMSLIFF